ncbi:MAG: hypothetical protein WDA41_04685 [Candidatus Neomarinimicrobiota bacterium]
MKLIFRQFAFRGDSLPGVALKDIQIIIHEPGKGITLRAVPPLIPKGLQIDLEFRTFEKGVLLMQVLSKRSLIHMLKMAMPDVLQLNYPELRVDTGLLSRKYIPGFRIRDMHISGNEYILEMELE